MAEVTLDQYRQTISTGITVVDYWAEWCQPCKKIKPVIESIEENNPAAADFLYANVDESQRLAMVRQILSVPHIEVYKDGELIKVYSSPINPNKLKTELLTFITE